MTTVLCPTLLHELPVSPWQALVECPPCGTRAWVDDLTTLDLSLCSCGHPARLHGPRHGLTHACPLATCPCNVKPKEKPMAETDHYREAVKSREFANSCDIGSATSVDNFQSAKVSALLAQVDATRAQTSAIRDLIDAIRETAHDSARALSNIAGP